MVMMMISMLNSKVIAAEGEHKASRALRHAAEVKMSIVVNDSTFNVFVNIIALLTIDMQPRSKMSIVVKNLAINAFVDINVDYRLTIWVVRVFDHLD